VPPSHLDYRKIGKREKGRGKSKRREKGEGKREE
jgi:hypothetical protein